METQQLHNILESCLLVAGKAMSLAQLETLFDEDIDRPERSEIKEALVGLQASYEGRGIELVEVSSGWRLQSAESMQHWVARMFEERPPRYSRALLETLVLIAYRQPITRGEIEDVRGVAVSSNIIRTLQEREWIKEMGFKDVPGKPALWGTTKAFLDYFNLKQLDELPTLAEARDLAEIDAALAAELGVVEGADDAVAANDEQGDDAQSEGAEVEGEEVESTDDADADSVGADVESAEDTHSAQQEVEQSEGSLKSLSASIGGENSTADESGLTDLANKLSSDDDSNDAPKLANLVVGLEAEAGVDDEPNLADLADGMDTKANAMDETQLADLAGYLENQLVNGDEPKLADLSVGFEAESGDANESKLTDLASSLETESGEPTLSDAVSLFDDTNSSDSELSAAAVDHSVEQTESTDHSVDDDVATSSNERPVVEASEISAFDLDVEQWPERKNNPTDVAEHSEHATNSAGAVQSDDSVEATISNDTEVNANADSVERADLERGEAEADLRRVIDDFAEEHQKQLDDRDLHRAELNERNSSGPKPTFENDSNKVTRDQEDSFDSGTPANSGEP